MVYPLAVLAEAPHSGLRLDVFLAQRLGEGGDTSTVTLSRARIQQLIADGAVQVDGAQSKASNKVKEGQNITLVIPEPEPMTLVPTPMDLDVLYEDAHLLVLNKAAGVVVHPGAGHAGDTLVHGLLAHCQDLSGIGGVLRPGIVHRLDAGTTGVMVIAKSDQAHQHLAAQFADRKVQKRYQALIYGQPQDALGNPLNSGRMETPYGRHPTHRQKMTARLPATEGCKWAITHWRLRGSADGLSLLDVALETGRTHQIRVHLSECGCPIVGDAMYGGNKKVPIDVLPGLDHQALHAAQLAFVHPVTGEPQIYRAPVPASWAAFAQRLTPQIGG